MKKMPELWVIIVAAVLVVVGAAAMFTTGHEDAGRAGVPNMRANNFNRQGVMYGQNYMYRQPYYAPQSQMYQRYPYAGQQQVALQAYSGPACAEGAIQLPEIGAEVLVAHSGGLMVTRVYQNSHAERNGLCVGDIITKFAGKKIIAPDAFFQAISAASPEAYVKFDILRSGKAKVLSIMMGKRELDGVVVPPDAAPAHPFAIPG